MVPSQNRGRFPLLGHALRGREPAASWIALELEAEGRSIGMADYLIAGICRTHSAILLTRNRVHFSRGPGFDLGRLPEPEG